jgi:hypothetical protein
MTSEWTNRFLSTAEFFALAKARLSLNAPEALTDPRIIPRDNDEDADPAVFAAIAAMRPIRTAAVLVPIIARAEPTVLFTQRTAHLADHAGTLRYRSERRIIRVVPLCAGRPPIGQALRVPCSVDDT